MLRFRARASAAWVALGLAALGGAGQAGAQPAPAPNFKNQAADKEIPPLVAAAGTFGLSPECSRALGSAARVFLRHRAGVSAEDGAFFLATYAVLDCPAAAYRAFWPKVEDAAGTIDTAVPNGPPSAMR